MKNVIYKQNNSVYKTNKVLPEKSVVVPETNAIKVVAVSTNRRPKLKLHTSDYDICS